MSHLGIWMIRIAPSSNYKIVWRFYSSWNPHNKIGSLVSCCDLVAEIVSPKWINSEVFVGTEYCLETIYCTLWPRGRILIPSSILWVTFLNNKNQRTKLIILIIMYLANLNSDFFLSFTRKILSVPYFFVSLSYYPVCPLLSDTIFSSLRKDAHEWVRN